MQLIIGCRHEKWFRFFFTEKVNATVVEEIRLGLQNMSEEEMGGAAAEDLLLRAGLIERSCPDVDFGLAGTHDGDGRNLEIAEHQTEEVEEFLDGLGQPCAHMVRACVLRGRPVDCSRLFLTTFIDLGLCCSFNVLPEVLVHDKSFERTDADNPTATVWNPQDGFLHPPAFLEGNRSVEVPFRSLSSGISNGISFTLDLQV